jgi:tyrosyl-tRNA synthetase
MFKKVMEIPDHLILRYFELATDEHPDRIEEIRLQLSNGINPRDVKLELAKIITGLYHKEEEVQKAVDYFQTVFQKGELPEDMLQVQAPAGIQTLLDLVPVLIEKGIISSGSEFRRLVVQGGVRWNLEKVTDPNSKIENGEGVLQLGKKKFIKISSLIG